MVCEVCGRSLSGRQRKFCGPVCKELGRAKRARPSGYARLTEDQREDRERLRAEKRRAAYSDRRAVGVDGEGHDGVYFLLAAASDDGFERHVWSTRGLTTAQCFDFLTSLPKEYTAWGFSFGYDVNMMLVDVPLTRLVRLHETGFLRWGPYRVHWIPGKLLQVSKSARFDWRTGEQGGAVSTVRVWDMYPWQGCSFVRWLEDNDLAPAETIAEIRRMKDTRPDFDPKDREEILSYCLSECRFLSRGANRVHSMLDDTGLTLRTFHSPATVSKALFKQNEVGRFRSALNPPPADMVKRFDASYFGGRAETTRVGPVPGPLFMYDIRSAYPTAMLEAPCWAHGRWREHDGPVDPLCMVEASWNAPKALWGPLPVRSRVGSLKWPTKGRGWFWGAEVNGVSHLCKVEVHRLFRWEQDCDHRPFGYVQDLYDERAALKAAGDPRQYVLKIALNASYGATAEHPRRGMRYEPRWREPAWAGFITAFTRGMIGSQLGDGVVMVATDGILASRPLDVPIGTRLGEWECEEYAEGFIVGPGVYFLRDEAGRWSKFKSRGIDARAFRVEDFQDLWNRDGREGRLPVPQQRFVGLGTALHRVHGMEPPGERMWRKFVDLPAVRSLSLEPRRRWLTADRWDGRSLAPTPGMIVKAERRDTLTMVRLVNGLRNVSDEERLRLYWHISGITNRENEEPGKGLFLDSDQPWN